MRLLSIFRQLRPEEFRNLKVYSIVMANVSETRSLPSHISVPLIQNYLFFVSLTAMARSFAIVLNCLHLLMLDSGKVK